MSTSSSFSVLIDRDCTLSPITRTPPISTMYYYAIDHIPRYREITTYPNDPEYNPNTNGVTNFSYAFYGLYHCKDTIGSIMNRFDWNSCTDMSNAFHHCENLTGSIPYIPNSVTDMINTFYFCRSLTGSIPNIPNSVTNMSNAFPNCWSLTGSIPNIPDSVTDMSAAFYDCYNLKGPIGTIGNSVTNMSDAFYNCRKLAGSIPNIPNSVTNMRGAFFWCSNITGSIPNIPNSVTYMGDAFYNCSKLSSSNVYIHSNNITNALDCFYGMSNYMNIYVHAGTKTYNSFYTAMGGEHFNSRWKCFLKTF